MVKTGKKVTLTRTVNLVREIQNVKSSKMSLKIIRLLNRINEHNNTPIKFTKGEINFLIGLRIKINIGHDSQMKKLKKLSTMKKKIKKKKV
jgi:hypothetical protein